MTAEVRSGSSATVVTGDAVAVPTDVQGESNTYCAKWHQVQSGDYCSLLSVKYSISLTDLLFLNPQIDANCTNLWLNTSYCVEAVGNIATYSAYPFSTAAYVFPKPTSTSFTPTPVALPSLNPTAPGTLDDCDLYENPVAPTESTDLDLTSCETWAVDAGVDLATFVSWNPSLSTDNCVLDTNYSYCMSRNSTEEESLPYSYCFPANTTLIPDTSLQPSQCACYIQLRAQDQELTNCTMFASLFDTSTALVTSLNPWIGSDCDSGLWSQMSVDGYVQVCVKAVSGVTVTPSSTTPTTTTTTTTTSTTSETSATPPAETQPGATIDCSLWHVVESGDGCQTIADEYGVSLEDFYTWNPGVGSDCSTLWLGYAVCVAI